MDESKLRACLRGHPWAPLLTVLPETASTNDDLKAAARSGAPEGSAILAARQTSGRGRLGRHFFSPSGGIYLSVLLRPQCAPERLLPLTALAAVAACDAIAEVCGLSPQIKWPNDLLLSGKKIAGILTEPSFGGAPQVVIGIGVNFVCPPEDIPQELRGIMGALYPQTPAGSSAEALAAALLRHFSRLPDALTREREAWLSRFAQRCVTIGADISVLRGDTRQDAVALGIDENAALLVRYPDGRQAALAAGEVSIRGLY